MRTLITCAFFICFCFAKGADTNVISVRFNATKRAYARYEGWRVPSLGIARLQFCFKTVSQSAVLLYQEDYEDSYVFLRLYKGMVDIEVRSNGHCQTNTKIHGQELTNLADSQWHKVHIKSNMETQFHLTLTVDGLTASTVNCPGALKLPRTGLNGEKTHVYMGGNKILEEPAKGNINYLVEDAR